MFPFISFTGLLFVDVIVVAIIIWGGEILDCLNFGPVVISGKIISPNHKSKAPL